MISRWSLLINLSLRNLFRQKRRNFFLGIAMALGVMILVIANSFSNGISDIMFNKVMRWVVGHVSVRFNEKGGIWTELFRDRERALAAIGNEPSVIETNEAIGYFMRAIGNGKSDNIILVGADTSKGADEKKIKEIEESFKLLEGRWQDLRDSPEENPAIISVEKARNLNVRRGDTIRVRFRNMFGQDQAARLTVVGIMKNNIIFMQPVIFVELQRAKNILGYRPYETGSLSLTLKDPQKNARAVADRIHERLRPGTAAIDASVIYRGRSQKAAIFGYRSGEEEKKKLSGMVSVSGGSLEDALKKDGVMVSTTLALALNVSAGDTIEARYENKFEKKTTVLPLKVSAVCGLAGGLDSSVILWNEEKFYNAYFSDLPKTIVPRTDPHWAGILAQEWTLLDRTYNTDDYKKKYQEMGKKKWKGTVADISTMYETASDILKLEGVLNLITLSAVLVLFFIILLGVVNTLRMTIRERTREIGTVRAIGMQKEDIRNIFILETFFLTLFASIAGVCSAFGAMELLSMITLEMSDNPFGMLLVNGHPYFLPTAAGILGNMALIIVIAVVTAYFPARRASKMSPAKALRHFE